MTDFNITTREDSLADLLKTIEASDAPATIKTTVKALIEPLGVPKDGYAQLTTFGSIGKKGEIASIVLNFSTHVGD